MGTCVGTEIVNHCDIESFVWMLIFTSYVYTEQINLPETEVDKF